MLNFFAGAFAMAGLAAAAGPLVIHLARRRRYQVVDWAAVELLLEALGQRRRLLRLRDLALLALRSGCVLLFGLAMARPYFSPVPGSAALDQPVHAVLVLDNSLSMGYQRLDGTVLDEAKALARQFIDRLPPGSRTSVLALCGPGEQDAVDPYRTTADALRFLESIEVVDRQGSAGRAVELALEACRQAPELRSKRVVFLCDQQAGAWAAQPLGRELEKLPDLQVAVLGPKDPANAWIADFRLQDPVADAETSTMFVATVRYEGAAARTNVQVTLTVDGAPVAARTIHLAPGESRQVGFPYHFDAAAERGRASFATASVSIPPDRLPADDRRCLVVPVASALPVLFVDEYGRDEDPRRNRRGETFPLRRLLAPAAGRGDYRRQLVEIRQARIDEVSRELVEDARLVVVAGVERPGASVGALREYVERGGQLVIAAGGRFDPAAWNDAGWMNGAGILPAPLEDRLVGRLPDETAPSWHPFSLDVASMAPDDFFAGPGSGDELAELYRFPLFFRAVAADINDRSVPPTLAEGEGPRTLASFTNGLPFLVERNLGRGQVLLVASGIQPEWNTLTRTNAVLLLDRIVRVMLARTLPKCNLGPVEQVQMAIEPAQRLDRFVLARPGNRAETLSVEAREGESYGVTARHLTHRGIYRLAAYRTQRTPETQLDAKLWEVPLAVNGPEQESSLPYVARADFEQRIGQAPGRWLRPGEPIRLSGAEVWGENIWKGLLAGVLLMLLLELVVLAWPVLAGGRAA